MATTLIYDLAVKTGEYQDNNGNTKGRYENVGKVLRNDNGQFMLLKKTFNPAGVNSDGDMVMVSMFDPKPRDGGQGNQRQQDNSGGYGQQRQEGGGPGARDLDDMIPFAAEWRI